MKKLSFLVVARESRNDVKRYLPLLIAGNLCLVGLGIYYLLVKAEMMISIFPFFGAVVFSYALLQYSFGSKKREEVALEKEFVHIFGFFETYLRNRVPVYSALNQLIAYASDSMADKIRTLIEEIDQNKTVEPYIHFAENFSSLAIKEVMISIYLLVEQGENDLYLRQFSTLFSSFSKEEKKMHREKRIASLSNLHFFPLVGSAITMIMITIGIMNAIGGIMNGQ